jgi:glutaredoxin 2
VSRIQRFNRPLMEVCQRIDRSVCVIMRRNVHSCKLVLRTYLLFTILDESTVFRKLFYPSQILDYVTRNVRQSPVHS